MMKLIALCLALCIFVVNSLTVVEFDAASARIRQLIDDNPIDGGRPRPFLPGFVRLAFHDCVGGTCDGCINLENDSNAGLKVYIDALEEVYLGEGYDDIMSRADFWALAGTEAVKYGAELSVTRRTGPVTVTVAFRSNRIDCATSPTTTEVHTFPDAHSGLADTLLFFQNDFEFNQREVVALLGAHTLGRASRANSGFVGPWVAREDRLDNAYYRDMTDTTLNWIQVDLNANRQNRDARFQWRRGGTTRLMLNADMCLFKDFQVSEDGSASCTVANDCLESSAATDFADFALNNNQWLIEFGLIFTKMIDHGSSNLQNLV